MRFSLSIAQVLAIVCCVCLSVNVDAKKPTSKPVVADDVVCDACIGPGEISPGTVGIPELDQGFLDLVDAGIASNTTEIGNNRTDIDANGIAIQANTQAIATVAAITIPRVKANGQDIGAHLSGTFFTQLHMSVLSNTGYLFGIAAFPIPNNNTMSGEIEHWVLRYGTTDCTGQAYVGPTNEESKSSFASGMVIASDNLNDPLIYYSPKGSTFVPGVVILSRTHIAGCTTFPSPVTMDAIEVFPNDPQITGVPTKFFDPPITLDVQTFLVPVPSLP